MGDVDDHSELVHDIDHAHAERRQAAGLAGVAGATAESIRVRPGERHVPCPASVKFVQSGDKLLVGHVAETVSTLDADQERDLVRLCGASNLGH